MDHLVERLLVKQPIEFESRTSALEELKERLLDMKFVFITFPKTKGGTELGIDVDIDLTDVKNVDFTRGTGTIYVVGTCELNYQKVRCIAEIDLSTKKGIGHLELLK
ncbi:MAG: MbtH domain protein [Candidatus Babeliales bacterium]